MQQWSTLHCAIPVTDNWIVVFQWHGQSTLTACLHSDHSYIQHFAFSMQLITTSIISFTILRYFLDTFIISYIPGPPRTIMYSESGFKCSGCEPGLGYCNPTKPNCPSTDHALKLTCAKPELALTDTGIVYHTSFVCGK